MAFNQGLNRVTLGHFADLPGNLSGTMAHQWLSTWGIAEQMHIRVDTTGLPPIPRLSGAGKLRACAAYPLALNQQLLAGDEQARLLTEHLGAALATLVMTLRRAPEEARAARPEWPDSHWHRWMNVVRITLGGGVLEHELGRRLFESASQWIEQLSGGVRLTLPPEPRMLMLSGLGREFKDGPVVVVDAGHTALKRGVVMMRSGQVLEIKIEALVPTPYHLMHAENPLDMALGAALAHLDTHGNRKRAEALLQVLLDAMIEASRLADQPTQFGLSLSVPVDAEGNVAGGTGTTSLYGLLAGIELQSALQSRLRERLGHSVQVIVRHEGQAAVNALPGADAAILLGTSVGGALASTHDRR